MLCCEGCVATSPAICPRYAKECLESEHTVNLAARAVITAALARYPELYGGWMRTMHSVRTHPSHVPSTRHAAEIAKCG